MGFIAESAAAHAVAGDCFVDARGAPSSDSATVWCLPALVNIGVQKAGTGELRTWVGAHPSVHAHGGEVHFFDVRRPELRCANVRQQSALRIAYAKYLWSRRHRLTRAQLGGGKITFEKTPAYFDQSSPPLVSCALPGARFVLMLRLPAARALSAYRMCRDDLKARWCQSDANATFTRILHGGGGDPVRTNRAALRRSPQLRRMLRLGKYALHLDRW